jgi:predicted MFS family arabinose efflux permease
MQGTVTSTVTIGAIVGGEGIMALWVPLVVGPWSDRLRTRIGGRLPFLLAATPLMAAALVALGVVSALLATAVAAAVFFFAYFIAYEPYRALYPDLLKSSEVAGRSQGTQAAWRGLGTGVALLAGGLLLSTGRLAPFAAAAAVLVLTNAAFAWIVVRRGLAGDQGDAKGESVRDSARRLLRLVREHPPLRAYLMANALWELALAALKAFVVLYITKGLGYSLTTASLIVGGVGGIVLAGALGAGKVGDDRGRLDVMRVSLWVYGLGLLVPALITLKPLVALAVPLIALGGGAVMALSYAILMPLMPEDDRGAVTGFYSASRGIGITIGPILAGALIAVLDFGPFDATHGYQATWFVCSAAILLSIPLVRRLSR